MLFALGAASSLLDGLQSLTSSKSSSSQSSDSNQAPANPFDLSGGATFPGGSPVSSSGGFTPISPATMSALLAAQGQSSTVSTASAPTSRSAALQDLFSQIDANGDGQISQSEFENALGAGGTNLAQADSVFSKLDTNGDGSVSLDEMLQALKGGKSRHHHHHGASGSANGANIDPLLQALSGASSSSVTNSDGSTTTSLTYADGSTVTLTSPAATPSGNASSSYNFIERMIQREAQAISSGATSSLSLNV